jgi:hypothetical protein
MQPLSIYIATTGRAYNSEAQAYTDFFEAAGHRCDFGSRQDYNAEDYDVEILFHGLHPFWQKRSPLVVGEYQSLSTGAFGPQKDVVKRVLNRRSDIKVFLNEYVRKGMFFGPNTPHFYRPMGYFKPLTVSTKPKEFDVVYAGSERKGVTDIVARLADLDLSVLLLGDFQSVKHPGVTSHEPVSPKQVWEFLDLARVGLNLVPLRRPFISQDSTKVIEYTSRGLGVLSNAYEWVDNFYASRGGSYMNIDDVTDADSVRLFGYRTPRVGDLEWNTVLSQSGLLTAIEQAVEAKKRKAVRRQNH